MSFIYNLSLCVRFNPYTKVNKSTYFVDIGVISALVAGLKVGKMLPFSVLNNVVKKCANYILEPSVVK